MPTPPTRKRSQRGKTPEKTLESPTYTTTAANIANDVMAPVRDLEIGARLSISRTQPQHARGWCADVVVPQGGVDDLCSQIQARFGGGTFLFQPKRRMINGKSIYTSGAATVDIMGEPTIAGRRWIHGELEPPLERPPPTMAMQPMPQMAPMAGMPQMAPVNTPDPMQMQLLKMFGDAVKNGNGANTDIAALADVMLRSNQQSPPNSSAQVDSMVGMERAFSLFVKWQSMLDRGGESEPAEPEPASSLGGLLGGGEMSLEKILMFKMLGDMGGSGGGLAGLLGGAPQPPVAAPMGGMPPPPSAAHVWHQGTRAWVHPSQLAQPVAAPPSPAPPSPAPPAEPTKEDEEDPLTAAEMIDELGAMDPAERNKILPEIMRSMGVPAEMLEQATASIAARAGVAVPAPTIGDPNPVADASGAVPVADEYAHVAGE
jgi:hypothetical protein